MTDRYAVFGNPIAHSKSPLIHTLFAEETEQDMAYVALSAPIDGFADAARAFFDDGSRGCNITMPFKLDAHNLADELSAEAAAAGAVNTLMRREDGSLYGHNTDGEGLVLDLMSNQCVVLKGKRILLLGAGGAARGTVLPLLKQHPAQLHIANRTPVKAEQLAAQFADHGSVTGSGYDALGHASFDVIINSTSSSQSGEVPPIPDNALTPGGSGYDMIYNAEPTVFVRWLQEHQAHVAVDGAGMLVEQAASAFALWRGVRPDTRNALKLVKT